MRIIQAVILENNPDAIKQFRAFEIENSLLFSIIDIVSEVDVLSTLINIKKPDLLILSLEDASIDFKFLNNLTVQKPKLIITSSNKLNAFEAYKQHAIDFILKPFNSNVLIISLYKTLKFIEMEAAHQRETIGKIKTINTMQQNFEYVAISSVDKIELLKKDEIIFCKADGKYTEFYALNSPKKTSSRNLGEYSEALDGNFFRIHHSYIINIKFLVKVIKKDGLYCELVNGHLIPIAKRRQEEFLKFINL